MATTTHLIVDIETRADTSLIAATGYTAKEGQFLPLIYHLPVAVAVGHMTAEGVLTAVESLGDPLIPDDPCALTHSFWELANHAAVLVTYNGRGFDVPVLELCALRYGAECQRHFKEKYGTRYRYGTAHIDLLDVLTNYGGASKGLTLSNIVQLLGYHGKNGVDGSMVQQMWEDGKLNEIQSYNRLDICRTFAIWLQWARISGRLTDNLFQQAIIASKPFLDLIR